MFTAAVSAFIAWRKGELLNKQTSISSVKSLSWKSFENLVGEAYRRTGCHVQDNTSSHPGGRIDLTVTKEGEKYLVQCKNWRVSAVGVKIVKELYGVVTAENASGGIIVCSGNFTRDAIEFARGKSIELVEGAELVRLIGGVQTQKKVENVTHDSSCPACGGPMVIRAVRKG